MGGGEKLITQLPRSCTPIGASPPLTSSSPPRHPSTEQRISPRPMPLMSVGGLEGNKQLRYYFRVNAASSWGSLY